MKKIVVLLFTFVLFLSTLSSLSFWANDLLDKAFSESKSYDNVVDIWNTSDAVGNQIFKWWKTLSLKWLKSQDPIIVRVWKLLLRITIAVWVTMFLIWWIMFLLSMWDDWKMKKARNNLFLAWVWIVLALASMWIIALINSLARTIAL